MPVQTDNTIQETTFVNSVQQTAKLALLTLASALNACPHSHTTLHPILAHVLLINSRTLPTFVMTARTIALPVLILLVDVQLVSTHINWTLLRSDYALAIQRTLQL